MSEHHPGAPLCAVADIPDGGSEGFFTETSDGRLLYMVVRQGADVFVYKNACPHTGMPLDFKPGRFLTADGALIQCSTHGAKFQITDGLCVVGPCKGDRLESVAVAVQGGEIFLTQDD
ncbi:MAG: Rieske 2Fe-2S domain-containing protein [Alphaproteobacteria bacterium]|nr:Rieske 2Fe-2S domain-containing protein [Alphaproteobacteria bacterium]